MLSAKLKSGEKEPKEHHYVSCSYLSRFADVTGSLHVYDRLSGKSFPSRPREIMHQSHYYRQEWAAPGVDPNVFEKILGQWLENDAPYAMDHLIFNPFELTEHDATTLLLYLELQRIKVPRQAAMAEALMRDTILRLAPPDITADLRAGKHQLVIKKPARFEYMRNMLGVLTPWFASMEWEVVAAENGSAFITTDSPLSLHNVACKPPAEAGMALAGTRVLFPLSSTHLLIMRHAEYRDNPSIGPLTILPDPLRSDRLVRRGTVWSKHLVANHNLVMTYLADRFIVGKSRELLEQCMSATL